MMKILQIVLTSLSPKETTFLGLLLLPSANINCIYKAMLFFQLLPLEVLYLLTVSANITYHFLNDISKLLHSSGVLSYVKQSPKNVSLS